MVVKHAEPVKDQVTGIVVDQLNQMNQQAMNIQLSAQHIAFEVATEQMQKVRVFIANPSGILGSMSTKHGEIAEQVEVGVRNARQAIEERLQDESLLKATFEGVGRTAPVDYMIDNIAVQSKFINGAKDNLDHVLRHLDKHREFGRTDEIYHIPKDHWQTIRDVLDGKPVDDLNEKSIRAIQEKVVAMEQATGRSFDDLVRPGISDYRDVQLGRIEDTLDKYDQELADQNQQKKAEIVDDHRPSLQGAANAAMIGVAVAGVVTLGTGIYKKYCEGRNIFKGELTKSDWQELGIDTANGALIGGVSAGAIYTLTNFAGMGAPFASALVTAAKGVGSLTLSLQRGEIDIEQFTDLGMIVCAEAAVVGAMTVAGQAVIPIPVLGALIGSISGKMLVTVAKGMSDKMIAEINHKKEAFIRRLSEIEQQALARIMAEFDALGDLTKAAFNIQTNQQLLLASVELARAYGVNEALIIATEDELDSFMNA
ncbi:MULTISPECIES: hypothetical protein [Aeromonas]|uniref:hypothetical protein n=1 Tax=Aeromonas TaxID=642 RepID=UPI0005A7C225|nr:MULTISPECIES: hypothetical protein [Aeromonas]OKP43100.1 hypothetical protein BJP22_01970 [Aeromonas veronii]RQM79955.1 hypothetical protein EHZ77_19435 [Aeromonas dhakensis]